MREELTRIMREYPSASREPFADHRLAAFVRSDAREALRRALAEDAEGLRLVGTPGLGQWADSPWLGALDPIVTDSPLHGYYVTYLFSRGMGRVYLSLQLGTTALRESLGSDGARAELRRLIEVVRHRIPEYREWFSGFPMDLEADSPSSRAAFYEQAHAFGTMYSADLPTEQQLGADLRRMVRLYRLLTFRGGLDELVDVDGTASIDDGDDTGYEAEEAQRYRYHRQVERNRTLAAKAKKAHGHVCQACGMDFGATYGPIGEGYIEAHHIVPLAELASDGPVRLNARTDFVVLCANCHRMIHRKGAPRQLDGFRMVLRR